MPVPFSFGGLENPPDVFLREKANAPRLDIAIPHYSLDASQADERHQLAEMASVFVDDCNGQLSYLLQALVGQASDLSTICVGTLAGRHKAIKFIAGDATGNEQDVGRPERRVHIRNRIVGWGIGKGRKVAHANPPPLRKAHNFRIESASEESNSSANQDVPCFMRDSLVDVLAERFHVELDSSSGLSNSRPRRVGRSFKGCELRVNILSLHLHDHAASEGSKTSTPSPAKSLTLRVTTIRSSSAAVAAIMPSALLRGVPRNWH
jgi:hypothetical protein